MYQIDGESFKARVVYHPPPRAETPLSRATSAASASRGPSLMDLGQPGRIVWCFLLKYGKLMLSRKI